MTTLRDGARGGRTVPRGDQQAELAAGTLSRHETEMATDGFADHFLLRTPGPLRLASNGFLSLGTQSKVHRHTRNGTAMMPRAIPPGRLSLSRPHRPTPVSTLSAVENTTSESGSS
ncbi:MAG: hypothetical protein ACYDEP_14270 [Acidimicrobiales bacterium]